MSEWQPIKSGQVRVASITKDGQTCIWDSCAGFLEELGLFWTEGEGDDDELAIRFYQMDKEAIEALSEFTGW